MQTLKKIPGKALELETMQGGFYVDTAEQPNPGLYIIETKICIKCNIKKELNEFNKHETNKDRLNGKCKKCVREYSKIHYEKNREKVLKKQKEYNKNHNRAEYVRGWYQKNKLKLREKRNNYQKKRRKNNPSLRLNANVGIAISMALKGDKNGRHWETLVSYTLNDLKEHLELQFKDGMNWENYGKNGWHIDHKIPISLFNIQGIKSKGFKACWALENLQPMWASKNKMKNNKIFS